MGFGVFFIDCRKLTRYSDISASAATVCDIHQKDKTNIEAFQKSTSCPAACKPHSLPHV